MTDEIVQECIARTFIRSYADFWSNIFASPPHIGAKKQENNDSLPPKVIFKNQQVVSFIFSTPVLFLPHNSLLPNVSLDLFCSF